MKAKEAGNRTEMSESLRKERARNAQGTGRDASALTAGTGTPERWVHLLERVVERSNMQQAYKRVVANHGSAGVDGMSVHELKAYLCENWLQIKEKLLKGTYVPSPVRGVQIPKPNGGVRQLGIPTAVDRLIQQAIHQVLSPLYEPIFSKHSYGFRPCRSAHEAVQTARIYVAAGRRWAVDMDLEKFFDKVNHDILMSRLARRIDDKPLLKLIRLYLQAGIMQNGVVTVREMGTPQGGPLSPLLSNILLDELDKELEKRGHKFCRYADDCNIYVKSKRAGERVLASIRKYLWDKLKLTVSETKSKVDRPWKCKFLGYGMTLEKNPRLRIAPESYRKFRKSLKEVFRRGRGRRITDTIEELNPKLRGWFNYFQYAENKGMMEETDGWLRTRFRCIIWRQWKNRHRRRVELMNRGIDPERAKVSADNGFGPWYNASASHMKQAFPKRFFDVLGLISLYDMKMNRQFKLETAVYGTVRTVV